MSSFTIDMRRHALTCIDKHLQVIVIDMHHEIFNTISGGIQMSACEDNQTQMGHFVIMMNCEEFKILW
jgi:hypothetical protein